MKIDVEWLLYTVYRKSMPEAVRRYDGGARLRVLLFWMAFGV